MRSIYAVLGGLIAIWWASPSQAWGTSGHRMVCEIALRNLTPVAKAEVSRLLQSHPVITAAEPRNKELGWACTYPDRTVTGGPTRRDPEHFVNYMRNEQSVALQSGCGLAHECVGNASVTDFALLKSTSVADRHRAVALMYLGHWVGDIHQPLHSSFADDKGGGQLKTSGICAQNLHNAWDTCILERRVISVTGEPDVSTLQQAAASWMSQVTDADRSQWLSGAPWQWSQESYEITLNPNTQYCKILQSNCQYSASEITFTSNQRTVMVDETYATMASPIIKRRITQAGVRLGHLINLALDPAYRFGL